MLFGQVLRKVGLPAVWFCLGFASWSALAQTSQPAAPAPDEGLWIRNVRQVTSADMGLARSGEAYFSPDGKRISFQAYPVGKEEYQIYIMNLDGTGLKMISTGEGATTCSFWHPSGEKLIFASNHEDQRPPQTLAEVETMRPRGGEAAASQPAQHPGGEHAGGHPGEHGAGHPGEHPSGGHPGEQGAQADAHGGKPTHQGGSGGYAWKYYPGMDIYEYTLATGKLKRLTTSDGYDAEGSYSPDGKSIVYCSFRDGSPHIYICDADGGNPRAVTRGPGRDGGPFFSPDGKRVVYRSDRTGDGNLQVFVNNLAGTDERALTDHETFHWCPYWHPSGKWIIYTHADFRGRSNFDLYLVRDDGSVTYRVTSDAAFDGLPVFSPDGRHLMWTSTRGGLAAPQIFIADFIGLAPDGELQAKAEPLKTGAPHP